jgi:hypothetical protein
MKLAIVLSLLFSVSSFAQTALVKKLVGDMGGNGSECGLDKYDVKKFNYSKAAKTFVDRQIGDDQGHRIVFEWKLEDITYSVKYYAGDEWIKTLKTLKKNGQVKAIFGAMPNEEDCTESEYCSLYDVEIFFKDGNKVSCYFDWTT